MDPMLQFAIATTRRTEMERAAATERVAAELRATRPRRTSIVGLALTDVVARVRDTRRAAVAEPCPTC